LSSATTCWRTSPPLTNSSPRFVRAWPRRVWRSFEFPHLLELLHGREFDTIYHEHVFLLLALGHPQPGGARRSREVFHVASQTVHGGSLRVFLAARGTRTVEASVPALLAARGTRWIELSPTSTPALPAKVTGPQAEAGHLHPAPQIRGRPHCRLRGARQREHLFELLRDRRGRHRIHPSTAARTSRICFCLAPASPSARPKALLQEMPDYTLILPWNLASEIVAQQREYCDRGGKFFVPVPQPKVISRGPV